MVCHEATSFNVAICDARPYVVDQDGTKVVGSFIGILERLVKTCCHQDATLNVTRRALNLQDLVTGMGDAEQIIVPYTQMHGFQYESDNASTSFLPLLPSPGSMMLVDFDKESFDLFTILIMTWQLFLLMFVSCGLAGIVIWFADHWSNPEEFPDSFFKGVWEGYWWAFISMTTVGYGDSKPKSFLGRIFAMIWIITGISLFAVFTATLTTALNTAGESTSTLQGRTVAVLNGSEEQHLAILMGATPLEFNSLSEIAVKLEDDSLEDMLSGILLDYIYMPALPNIFAHEPLKITKEIPMSRVHGMLFQNLDDSLVKCFHKHGKKERYKSLEEPITDSTVERAKKMNIDGSETISNWLDINSTHLGIYSGCVVILFLLFVMWELLYNRNRKKLKINAQTQKSQKQSDVTANRTIPYKNHLQSSCDETAS